MPYCHPDSFIRIILGFPASRMYLIQTIPEPGNIAFPSCLSPRIVVRYIPKVHLFTQNICYLRNTGTAIRAQIAAGVDILVHLGRLRDRTRRVLSVMEVAGVEQGNIILNPLYEFAEMGERNGKITGSWQKKGELIHQGKLYRAGMEGTGAGL